MKRTPYIALWAIGLLSASLAGCSKQDRVTKVPADDPEMNAAIAKARDALPQFWRTFGKPEHGESDFSVKVRITDKKWTEHFWLTEIERKDGRTLGTINNDPEVVGNVKLGDRMPILEVDISDWLYMRDGKMVGNYTLRVLLKHMPTREDEKYKGMIADP
jgi:uncharacterized protein YegJ (DUF2314 family)